MLFNGDLSKYHPADAIMFLSQLGLNGIFSIAVEGRVIALNFSNGQIIDAQSGRGDGKVLQALMLHRRVSAAQVRHIRRIQAETGMPIRAILAQLNLFPLADAADIFLMGMREVLLEMFLLDRGAFNFTDTPVAPDDADTRLDASMQAIRVAAQSDEFRDFEKSIVSMTRAFTLAADTVAAPQSTDEKIVLRLAASCRSIGQIIEKAPLDSYTAMETVKSLVEKGALIPAPFTTPSTPTAVDTGVDPIFGAFRQALNTLMRVKDPLKRLEALVAYCKRFYDGMLILSAKGGQLVHCKAIHRQNGRGFTQTSKKEPLGPLAVDAVLTAVHNSGVGFFGEPFASSLLDPLAGPRPNGECALIPIATQGAVSLFLYVFSREKFDGLSPQHYLELLSWMVTANRSQADHLDAAAPPAAPPAKTEPPAPTRLVDMVDDLPPLPNLVSRALDLLADPDAPVKEIESVIEKDQSLVSKLIRVSNSALYGGMQRVESLQQALTRLGAKTSRSLIVSAAMQNYFLKSNSRVQAIGQDLWQHAAECGLAARRIAAAIGYDDPEKAFVGGIVHDIGKLVILLTSGDAYREIASLMRREALRAVEAETRMIGTDHVAVGLQLMDKWKMPASARICVAYHHQPHQAEEDRTLAGIAALSDHLSHCHGAQGGPVDDAVQAEMDAIVQSLGIDAAGYAALIASLSEDFQNSEL